MDIYKFLDENDIKYKKFEHEAVFTCDDVMNLDEEIPGVGTKNLFLRDKNGGRHFLVSVGHEKSVDISGLQEVIGSTKLSFGSAERLEKHLGVTPGAVTLLALINDPGHQVEVIIDKDIWGKSLQCHPLVNTATLVIEPEDFERFFELTGHNPTITKVPVRQT